MFKVCFALSALLATALATPWIAEPRDENWLNYHKTLLHQTETYAKEMEIIFLGDSITHGWAGNGKAVFDKHYGTRHVFNYGIGGDRTEHILWRLENKEFDGISPKIVTLMIGNLFSNL